MFEEQRDLDLLGQVFTARAAVEAERGNLTSALAFQQTAIRYSYLRPEPRTVAAHHYNLANYLREAGLDPVAQRAHRLAAALIFKLTGMTQDLSRACSALASDLAASEREQLPATVSEVIAAAEQTEGVRLGELIATLASNPVDTDTTLAQILDTAANLPVDQRADMQSALAVWEPVVAAVAAAAAGDPDAAASLRPVLDEIGESDDWGALVAVLRSIVAGARGKHLLEGLDPVDTAIVGRVLERLAPPPPERLGLREATGGDEP